MKRSSDEIGEDYINENAESIKDKDMDKVFEHETTIKHKMKHIDKLKNKVLMLFQLLKDYKNKKYTDTPWKSIAAIIFALLYVLNPLDIVPDFIPFVGYIDDASVFGFTLKLIGSDIEDYQLWLSEQENSEESEHTETV